MQIFYVDAKESVKKAEGRERARENWVKDITAIICKHPVNHLICSNCAILLCYLSAFEGGGGGVVKA